MFERYSIALEKGIPTTWRNQSNVIRLAASLQKKGMYLY
jgi:hypothetical protein